MRFPEAYCDEYDDGNLLSADDMTPEEIAALAEMESPVVVNVVEQLCLE